MKKIAIWLTIAFTLFFHTTKLDAEPRMSIHLDEMLHEEDVEWLVKNVYFEARNQPVAGQIAVIMVTLNRVRSERFPNTVREVVTDRKSKTRCQFSWYCDGKPDVIKNKKKYAEIRDLVLTTLSIRSIITDITSGALFYHADYVNPKWAKTKKRTIKIEDHIFYK